MAGFFSKKQYAAIADKELAITLRQFNMDTCFDKVKTGNPFKNNKAENFRELLADYKLQPDEMIYIT